MNTTLISVIIPTFNRSGSLLRAIHSVLNQTYKSFELIVVDDGSTDETKKILDSYINNYSVKYIHQQNKGVASARNTGAKIAQGSWLTFLDSDDEWLPQKLEQQMHFLEINPLLQIAYTEEIWIRNGVRVNQKKSHKKFGGWIFEKCLKQCFIAPSSVILHQNLFSKMAGFDENFEVCEDYDLWLKISCEFEIGFVSTPLIVKYGGHEDQLSRKFFAMDMWRLKSMHGLLQTRELSLQSKSALIEVMNDKGLILKKGYLKHGNLKAIEEIDQILLAAAKPLG